MSCADASAESPQLECDPLVPSYCAFPLPSNIYTVADPTTVTGLRVQLSESAVPISNGGGMTDGAPFNVRDGFSPGINLVTHMPGATITGLPRPDTIPASSSRSCPAATSRASGPCPTATSTRCWRCA